jgi:hypothetical protein
MVCEAAALSAVIEALEAGYFTGGTGIVSPNWRMY